MINQRIQEALDFKAKGNEAYQQNEYKKALTNYHKVFLYLNGLVDKDSELTQYAQNQPKMNENQSKQICEIKTAVYNNMAQIYIHQEQWDKGQKAAKNSLNLKESSKGLYRLGICEAYLNNYYEARQAFQKAKQLDQSLNIQNYLDLIDKFEGQSDKQLAQKLKNMFV
ncbi:hypothetical protein pb186bvf_006758 [Paramecium bursaria]